MIETAGDLSGDIRRSYEFGKRILLSRIGIDLNPDLAGDLSKLIGDCITSNSSFPVLAMGRDNATGTTALKGKYLTCDWKRDDSAELYDRIVETGGKIAHALGAKYQDNPAYEFFSQVITAHPLGGCAMATHKGEGVVNEWGEVFDEPGLYVCDGSVLPGPVGPNPALTIGALADRFATRIIESGRK